MMAGMPVRGPVRNPAIPQMRLAMAMPEVLAAVAEGGCGGSMNLEC